MLNTGKIYLHKILRNTVCWTLWEDLYTQNTEEYCMLSTVGRFIYTKYWGILHVEHNGKIYLHKILRNILYVEHCGKIYLHKILGITSCWALWEDFFTQNTGDYFLLNTEGIFIYIKYWEILYDEHWENICTQNTGDYFMLNTVGRFIYTKYRGIMYVWALWENNLHKILRNTSGVLITGKIYLHKILRNILSWTLGIFIYTKY